MKNYRPVRGRRVANPKRIALFAVIVAAAVVAVIFCVYMFSEVKLTQEKEQELLQTGTFLDGVSVEGIQLGGLTYAQGEEQVKKMADDYLNGNKIDYSVKDQNYSYALPDAGVGVAYQDALLQAMLYGREGTRWDLQFGKTDSKDFPVS